jgi:hypothetical protein
MVVQIARRPISEINVRALRQTRYLSGGYVHPALSAVVDRIPTATGARARRIVVNHHPYDIGPQVREQEACETRLRGVRILEYAHT